MGCALTGTTLDQKCPPTVTDVIEVVKESEKAGRGICAHKESDRRPHIQHYNPSRILVTLTGYSAADRLVLVDDRESLIY